MQVKSNAFRTEESGYVLCQIVRTLKGSDKLYVICKTLTRCQHCIAVAFEYLAYTAVLHVQLRSTTLFYCQYCCPINIYTYMYIGLHINQLEERVYLVKTNKHAHRQSRTLHPTLTLTLQRVRGSRANLPGRKDKQPNAGGASSRALPPLLPAPAPPLPAPAPSLPAPGAKEGSRGSGWASRWASRAGAGRRWALWTRRAARERGAVLPPPR